MLDQLQDRLKSLDSQIEQLTAHINQQVANVNMLRGSREEVLHWVGQLGKDPQPPKESEPA